MHKMPLSEDTCAAWVKHMHLQSTFDFFFTVYHKDIKDILMCRQSDQLHGLWIHNHWANVK